MRNHTSAALRRSRRTMAPLRLFQWLILAGLACSDPDGPGTTPTPTRPLENIPTGAIGTAKVAFQRAGPRVHGVYLVDGSTGKSRTLLDTVTTLVLGPSLSPSGDAIAWIRWAESRGGQESTGFEVYSTDLDGGHPKQLSFGSRPEGSPSWTPDGSAVVFLMDDVLRGTWGFYASSVAGSSISALRTFQIPAPGVTSPGCPNVAFHVEDSPASVSPSGGIAYGCNNSGWLAGAWGAVNRQDTLTAFYVSTERRTYVYAPNWSPDGSELAFLELLRDNDYATVSTTLKVLHVGSGAVRTVAVVPGGTRSSWLTSNPHSLCWLPDGSRIVFNAGYASASPTPVASLYVVGADGSNLMRLTTNPEAFDHSVSCSR